MKHKIGVFVLFICLFFPGCTTGPKGTGSTLIPSRPHVEAKAVIGLHQEYAYIGSAQGILEYRVKPDGQLKPLTGKPVPGSPPHATICMDQQAGRLFAIEDVGYVTHAMSAVSDTIYFYSIGKRGQLVPQFATPVKVDLGVQAVAFDPENAFLYLLGVDNMTSEEKLIIYDVQPPAQFVKRQTIILPTDPYSATIGNIIPGQGGSSLFLSGRRDSRNGKPRRGELQEYRVDWREASPVSEIAHHQMDAPLLAGIRVGGYLVIGDFANDLVVCEIKDNRVNLLSTTALSTIDLPGRIVYRKEGSVLYVGTVSDDSSPRTGTPPGRILVYHLEGNGQVQQINTKISKAVGDPYPYLDNSSQFLYVSGAEDTLDTYKVAPNGSLLPLVRRLKTNGFTGIVFFGGL